MLEVSGLEVAYRGVPALRGVDLTVGDGETVALVGPNGAGKTSLAAAVAGVVRPRAGSMTWTDTGRGGRAVGPVRLERMSPAAIVGAGIGHVPQSRRIFADLTVLENLRTGATTRRRSARQDIEWVMGLFPGLAAQAWRPAGTLPAGEQHVLALGRTLVTRPRLLIVDELSAGASPALTCQLFDVLRGLHLGGVGLLIIDQFVHLACDLADRVVVVENGRVYTSGSPDTLGPDDVAWQRTYPGGGPSPASRT